MWLCASNEFPAGTGPYQICPLCTEEKHLCLNVHCLTLILSGGPDAKCLPQGRDFWLLVILAADQAVSEF